MRVTDRAGRFARRVRRLVRALHPALARPNDDFAQRALPPELFTLFKTLDPRDREHALAVTRRVLKARPEASEALVQAALLHDCGKALRPFYLVERLLVGLWASRAIASPSPGYWPNAFEARRRHADLGAQLVLDAGGTTQVAELVRAHHNADADADALAIFAADALE